jgi:hypothetical protein
MHQGHVQRRAPVVVPLVRVGAGRRRARAGRVELAVGAAPSEQRFQGVDVAGFCGVV